MCSESLKFTCHKVSCDNTLGLTIDNYEVEHLMTRIALHCSCGNLSVESCISSEKKLLSGLSAGIESTAYLNTTERTVGKVSAVFSGERNTLSYALVNDSGTDFCKTIDVSLSTTIVTTFNGIVEKTIHRVIVILIVLGSIDTALSRDRVRTARRITDTENLYIITEFTKCSSCRRAAETCTDYNDFKFPFVVRTDKTNF